MASAAAPLIRARNLSLGYGQRLLQQNLNFEVRQGDIFTIMGGSGCGKSTLLRHLVGLEQPAAGTIYYQEKDLWQLSPGQRGAHQRQIGVMYQHGALWSQLTLAENLALPLSIYTPLSWREQQELSAYKLALVGLHGFDSYYPAQLSGGMQKRAALARAMVLDPPLLFLDEPSAGLDPVTAGKLDDLILQLRQYQQTTFVIVSHELASLLNLGTNGIFLDQASGTSLAQGAPHHLRDHPPHPRVAEFFARAQQS